MELIAGRIVASQAGFRLEKATPVPTLVLKLEVEADAECAQRLQVSRLGPWNE